VTSYDVAVLTLAESVSLPTVSLASSGVTIGSAIAIAEYSPATPGLIELGGLSKGEMIVTSVRSPVFLAGPSAAGQTVNENVTGAPAFLLSEKGKNLGLVGLGQNGNSPSEIEFLDLTDPAVLSFIQANR